MSLSSDSLASFALAINGISITGVSKMPDNQYKRQIATVKRLIAKYGQSVEYVAVNGHSSTQKPWEQFKTKFANPNIKVLFLPMNGATMKTLGYGEGKEVPKGAVLAYMSQQVFAPKLADYINRDGVNLRIDTLDILAPSGVPILYTMVLAQ